MQSVISLLFVPLAIACLFFVLGARMTDNLYILNSVLLAGWGLIVFSIYWEVSWFHRQPLIPQILWVALLASGTGLVMYHTLWINPPEFKFEPVREMADPENNGEKVPEALSILGIPVTVQTGYPWPLPDATVQVRFANPQRIGHDPTQPLRWDSRGNEGRNGLATLTLHPGRQYVVRLVARYAHEEPPRGWYGVVLEENTLLNPKQENVKLPPGDRYTMRLEICTINRRFFSPWYDVRVPLRGEDNAGFTLTVSERQEFEIQNGSLCR